ncbi:hypothetical protein OHA72_34825 [Dactylosporangium sp. NBC_01737]|uniref:glycoside hydrolase family 95-like protein n=1 Tax=Dactylosporangium sp. NBC_01737 TaxID=2975959 RepID=UPI002E151F74|nr:hypothetical protein OHA72_34825 [Dactylosporangium sp. NBC_01737]
MSKGNFWAGNPNPSFVALGGVTIAPATSAPAGNLALGAVEAVDDLLLQSDNGVIRVFPVWPTSRNAQFVNLREKGAFLVSSQLTGGQVTYVDIASQAGRPVALLNPWGNRAVTVTRVGAGTVAHTTPNGTISFPTQAGATYQIVPN